VLVDSSIGKVYNICFVLFLMDELGLLRKKVNSQEKRIKLLEAEVFGDSHEEVATVIPKPVKAVKEGPGISLNQVITVLGILGISIGAISFFFYAVARGWIGEALQVGIGMLAGLVLFFIAYMLHEKKPAWSNVVFGGAYFLEYLSIGVGVKVYNVVPPVVGIILGFFILVSSMVLAMKFSARIIAYFSLVGGFLIPVITDSFESQIFVMIWYLFILIALSGISVSYNWMDLRAVMLVLMMAFMQASFGGPGEMIELAFVFLYFILFNVSSLINAILHNEEMNVLDSLILGALPIVFLSLIYDMLGSFAGNVFGLIVILFSFVYLLEAFYLKTRGMKFPNVGYALVAAGVATLNIGIYFLLNDIMGLEFFIVLFIAEWALFSYLSSVSKDAVYRVAVFAFLALIAFWYFTILRFNEGIGHASFFMVILAAVPLISLLYFRSNVNYKVSAATFIVSGYLFFYSCFKYLRFFVESLPFREIILSILWLIYTLSLFVQVQTKEGKLLVGVLLGITLLKIALRDLLFLEGVFRIIGFILFGVLLLIGGYFLEHAKK